MQVLADIWIWSFRLQVNRTLFAKSREEGEDDSVNEEEEKDTSKENVNNQEVLSKTGSSTSIKSREVLKVREIQF